MFTDKHLLIGPYHDDSSDPNAYCSCKEFQVQNAIVYSKSQLTILHLKHIIDELYKELKVQGEGKETVITKDNRKSKVGGE